MWVIVSGQSHAILKLTPLYDLNTYIY